MSMDIIAPLAPEFTPVRACVEPIDVEPLWEQIAVLVAERKRNRFEIGKLLDELHGRYAQYGYGTYTARAAAICGSRYVDVLALNAPALALRKAA